MLQKLTLTCLAVCSFIISIGKAQAANVGVDPGASWIGFMNVFEIPQHGGAYVYGNSWGTADLSASFSGPVLTLSPNTVNDPNPFWYSPSGGPGSVGNKTMDANMYVETTGVYAGQTLNFSGNVLANTLVGHVNQLGNGWTSVAFIKDFAPDYSSSVSVTAPLVNGVFNLSLGLANDPARHVQYGFETVGPDVWATDVGPYGSIQITAVPEPSSLALFGLVALVASCARRRK
jgi:hypothetical protein